jgi:hypothetical protein
MNAIVKLVFEGAEFYQLHISVLLELKKHMQNNDM